MGRARYAEDLEKLRPVLLGFAVRATRDREVAQDLAQDAMLAALAQAASFDERSSLRTWVIGILAHKITDHHRRARVRLAKSEAGAEDESADERYLSTPSGEDVERVVMARQELGRVDRALASLPERERLALLLLDVEEADREIACNALDVSATHLRVLMHRARNHLRLLLQKEVA